MVLRVSNCSPHPAGPLCLEDFAALRVSGEDRVDFLQGQLSQDMGRVTPSQAAPAAWCNRQGRVLCLMVAVDWQDAIFLILPAEMAETCAVGLGRYVLRAKVRIEAVQEPVFGCAFPGGKGGRAHKEGETPSLPGEAWRSSGTPEFCAVRLPGRDSRALVLGKPPAELVGAGDSGWTAERWKLADIEAEIPWVDSDTSGKFLAHSLNLDLSGAVSFTKGCYVGQEIIARMEHRGRPKRRMQRVHLPADSAVEAGARVDHPEHGAVTIITWSAAPKRVEALAEVRLAQDGP